MQTVKKLLLMLFMTQVVACGQKGALYLPEANKPDIDIPETKRPEVPDEKAQE